MPKYRVEELEGALLDAAVAKAEGLNPQFRGGRCYADWVQGAPPMTVSEYRPSLMWDIAGPIIGRERISVMIEDGDDFWTAATKFFFEGGIDGPDGYGPTPLIAAMRAYVASKFGQEVELP